ncbi:tRNA-intron lyase [Stygiolobus caldivivus]|uniref:tRNA-splicing endonuclease n=1 Tax=Stygiolobus caldivivus TaxID=2824673 RepID=A0A8D5U6T0_9CREN|nr:tRNA-intron lyase [Stygiolobus caldivivus]BCU70720.1 tRNA-intron lyase [Stygiolobus caldivivus]
MPPRGKLIKDKVLVEDVTDARSIYSFGYYGKPLDILKPKTPDDIKSPLILSIIEAVYLLKKGLIEVQGDIDGNEKNLSYDELYKIGADTLPRFGILYSVYEDLRDKNYVVRSGIKYGADFAVYTIGPGIEHAPYLVIALKEDEDISPNEILGFGRVSHSTRKELILGIVNPVTKNIRYIIFKWLKI